jgi:hypothetical protein
MRQTTAGGRTPLFADVSLCIAKIVFLTGKRPHSQDKSGGR